MLNVCIRYCCSKATHPDTSTLQQVGASTTRGRQTREFKLVLSHVQELDPAADTAAGRPKSEL